MPRTKILYYIWELFPLREGSNCYSWHLVNNLPAKISSTIRLYADNVILFREINLEENMLLYTSMYLGSRH